RGVSHDVHPKAAGAARSPQAGSSSLAGPRSQGLERVSAPRGEPRRNARSSSSAAAVLLAPTAVRDPRQARRAVRIAGLCRGAPSDAPEEPVLMRILGISAHYHDSAAALLVDGIPICAVQEERLSRRKNDAAFPLSAIECCLEQARLEPEQLDAVVFYEKPMLKFDRILTMALRGFPRTWRSFPRAMQNALGGKLWVKGIIASQLGIRPERILFCEHHQSHAAAAFLTAPVQRAAILTADGVGEWATLTLGRGEIDSRGQARLEISRELRFPHSLGMLYSTFTAYLGFPVNEGEYKVMGLAAYGRPAYEELLWRIVRRTADGGIALDLSYFDFHQGARQSWSRRLVAELGPPRHPWQAIDPSTPDGQRCADIAASVQRVLEEILVD